MGKNMSLNVTLTKLGNLAFKEKTYDLSWERTRTSTRVTIEDAEALFKGIESGKIQLSGMYRIAVEGPAGSMKVYAAGANYQGKDITSISTHLADAIDQTKTRAMMK